VWLGLILSIVGVVRAFSPRAAYRGKVLGSIGLLFSAALTGLFTLYIFVFSYMLPQPTDVAAPQTIAPDFTLADQHGRSVSLSELRGRNVVIVFYRGHW
jgi:cytochrome oxidase Cu insertion factor (SCO1/SenC/PrrC family)